MKHKVIGLLLIGISLAACTNNNVYFQYRSVNPAGWNQDSIYTFDVEVTDTISAYNLYINVRNTPDYTNQNLWLFIAEEHPDGTVLNDTIEFYLADVRGKWLGSGAGAVKEMPVLFQQDKYFERSGTYTYKIRHGMRYDELRGINEIGLRVEKLD